MAKKSDTHWSDVEWAVCDALKASRIAYSGRAVSAGKGFEFSLISASGVTHESEAASESPAGRLTSRQPATGGCETEAE